MAERSLIECERTITAHISPSMQARRLHSLLADIVKDFGERAVAARTEAERELIVLYSERIEDTRRLLRTLDGEQSRQREVIKHYLHGMADRDALRRVSDSWNGDAPPSHKGEQP